MKEIYKVYKICKTTNQYGSIKGDIIEVSNLGNVKRNGIIQKPFEDTIYLSACGNRIHRMVAELFVHNSDPIHNTVVDHIDGNSKNNVYTNLRWCTIKQNINNPITKQRQKNSLINNEISYKKHVICLDKQFNKLHEFISISDAARFYDISVTLIRKYNKDKKFYNKGKCYFIIIPKDSVSDEEVQKFIDNL